MFLTRHEILSQFPNPVFVQHPFHSKGVRTFSFIPSAACIRSIIELPKIRVELLGIDYCEYSASNHTPLTLHFQQDCFRLWFQVDGNGILQNLSKNIFGAARPGLLGVMERSQRYTYLHQKGTFESFQILFSLLPSPNAKCYWNSGIEGKFVLEGDERQSFENSIFDLLLVFSNKKEAFGLSTVSHILGILKTLFTKNILTIEEAQFPKNKAKGLVAKAKMFMELHYARMRHQKELEQECSVDLNYLNIIFKRDTGRTLFEYLTHIRMEQAKHFLETTDDAVTDIANRVGYPNNNSFSRAFKHREQCTPHDYRLKKAVKRAQ
jgi:AraC-like DNA-binding protein